MVIKETLYVTDRNQWRSWLAEHHATSDEIWLVYYKLKSKKPRIPYNDAVEEALCYGWIDSTLKTLDEERFAQRFSPRRKNSRLSELNKERIRRLMEQGKMTAYGFEKIRHHLADEDSTATANNRVKGFSVPADILKALKRDPLVWEHFNQFPLSYQRIRIGWIDSARTRPDIFETRLRYFIKMTAKNKMYGMVK